MTEMTPLGTLCNLPSSLHDAPADEQCPLPLQAGHAAAVRGAPRARPNGAGAPWDGTTMGELEVRGPWVAAQYYNVDGPDDRFTEDGWFRTGDIVTIDPDGCIELTDRAKDLVKSGGEWISSVALETALMGHPAVAEAAVVAVPHPKWDERPLAVVVLRAGHAGHPGRADDFLAPQFAKWWLPDAIEFTTEIPRLRSGSSRSRCSERVTKRDIRQSTIDLLSVRRPIVQTRHRQIPRQTYFTEKVAPHSVFRALAAHA